MKKDQEEILKIINRLEKIVRILENEEVSNYTALNKRVGGTSIVFTYLKSNNIIYKENDKYKWNEKIPVSIKLATTIFEYVREYGRKRYNRPVVKKEKEVEIIAKKEISNKLVAKKYTKEEKRGFSFNLFWGMLKIDKV